MKYCFLLLSFCLVLSVKADIGHVSRGDTQDIESFFHFLIQQHDFAYTIFGSKPMSLADINLEMPPNLSLYKQLKARFILTQTKRWLNTWYKNKSVFSLKNFILLDQEYDFINCLIVVLINKKNLLDTLRKHEYAFKQELGDAFTPELLLEQLDTRKVTLAQAIHKSQRLLGIMLGYGERNATIFQERFDLMKTISKRKKDDLPPDKELIAKLNILETQVGDFSELEEDAIIHPLYFLADISHPETIELKKQYEQDRQKIEEMMEKPHFMDNVLQRLTE
jgi:hypothetical protein